jgi:predicted Zn finger-like uncharacterized protein
MIVICPGCGKEYSFDEVSLPAAGAMGRCKACGTRFRIDRPGQEEQITCPACGFKQAGGSACLTCGLVFDKYKPRDEEQAETPSGATGRPGAAGSIPDALPPAEEEKTFGGSMGGPGGLKPPPDEIRFSLGGSFRFAWTVVRGNFLFLLAVLLLAMIISSIPDVLGRILFADSVPARLLLLFVSVFLQSVVTMGLVRVSLLFVDGREATFSDLFACASLFPAYFLASVLYGLMVFFGMLLLVVPGIILAIKYMFYSYAVVDRELGPVESLKRSSTITSGAKLELFMFILLVLCANIAGALALGIGMFVSIPVTMIALAYVYRTLDSQVEESAAA